MEKKNKMVGDGGVLKLILNLYLSYALLLIACLTAACTDILLPVYCMFLYDVR